jgi:hypothetical protein
MHKKSLERSTLETFGRAEKVGERYRGKWKEVGHLVGGGGYCLLFAMFES